MKISRADGWKLFGALVALFTGFYQIWGFNLDKTNIIIHLKAIYSLFWAVAIGIAVYLIMFKTKEKRNGKK